MVDIDYKGQYLDDAIKEANDSLKVVNLEAIPCAEEIKSVSMLVEKLLREKKYLHTDYLLNLPNEMKVVKEFCESIVKFLEKSKKIFDGTENETSSQIDDYIDEIYYKDIYEPLVAPELKMLELADGTIHSFYYFNQNNYPDCFYSEDPFNESSGIKTTTNYGITDKNGVYAQTIQGSGCGPTSAAIALTQVTGQIHDPVEVASVFAANDKVGTAGTYHSAFTETLVKEYDVNVKAVDNMNEVQEALKNPNTAVIAGCSSFFTRGGHLISIVASDSVTGKVYVADPNDKPNKGSNGSGWYDAQMLDDQVFGTYYIVSNK